MSKGRLIVSRIALNRGGYARGGRDYYGTGAPLYSAEFLDESGEWHDPIEFRAADRKEALAHAKKHFALQSVLGRR